MTLFYIYTSTHLYIFFIQPAAAITRALADAHSACVTCSPAVGAPALGVEPVIAAAGGAVPNLLDPFGVVTRSVFVGDGVRRTQSQTQSNPTSHVINFSADTAPNQCRHQPVCEMRCAGTVDDGLHRRRRYFLFLSLDCTTAVLGTRSTAIAVVMDNQRPSRDVRYFL